MYITGDSVRVIEYVADLLIEVCEGCCDVWYMEGDGP